MLILTRRPHEIVRVGDQITIQILGIARSQVWLGIAAPKEISAHRQKIYERIKNEEATQREKSSQVSSNAQPIGKHQNRRADAVGMHA